MKIEHISLFFQLLKIHCHIRVKMPDLNDLMVAFIHLSCQLGDNPHIVLKSVIEYLVLEEIDNQRLMVK